MEKWHLSVALELVTPSIVFLVRRLLLSREVPSTLVSDPMVPWLPGPRLCS